MFTVVLSRLRVVEVLAQRGVDELRQLAAQLARDLLEQRGFDLRERRAQQLVGELERARRELRLQFREQGVELGVRRGSRQLRMTSVSTGMLSSSCGSDIGSHLMSVELVAAVAIEAVALAALLAPHGIRVDDLGDALVAAEELRDLGGEIDQHVPAPRRRRLVDADQHRLERRLRRARRARCDAG